MSRPVAACSRAGGGVRDRPRARTPRAIGLMALTCLVGAASCGGAPWFLGQPLDGAPAIPRSSQSATVAQHRQRFQEAGRRGWKVVELSELMALESRAALEEPEQARLVELLRERTRDWEALDRPIPLAADLRHLLALEPDDAHALAPRLADAEKRSARLWTAFGDRTRAEESVALAARMMRLAGGDRVIAHAEEADPTPSSAMLIEPVADDRLYHGPTLARSLLPLVKRFPQLLAPSQRADEWSHRLLAEDATSPDSLEVAATIDALAGRIGGTDRKLVDLVYYSPDRGEGYERAAHVWERVGQVRRACRAWEDAARNGPPADPRWCDVIACVRQDPGVADADQVARIVHERAPTLACATPPPEGPR